MLAVAEAVGTPAFPADAEGAFGVRVVLDGLESRADVGDEDFVFCVHNQLILAPDIIRQN